jgi:hypothetical protein
MHPVMVLVAFAIAALVTYALVLAALGATSTLSHENRDLVPDDRHNPRERPVPMPELDAGTPLPPWAHVSGDRALHEGAPADAPATDRRSHVHC